MNEFLNSVQDSAATLTSHRDRSGSCTILFFCMDFWRLASCISAEKPIIQLLDYQKVSSVDKICENMSCWINWDTTFPSILLLFKQSNLSYIILGAPHNIHQYVVLVRLQESMWISFLQSKCATRVNFHLCYMIHAVYGTLLHIVYSSETDSDSESCKNAVEDICVCQVLPFRFRVFSWYTTCLRVVIFHHSAYYSKVQNHIFCSSCHSSPLSIQCLWWYQS